MRRKLNGRELDANTEIINSLGIAEQSLLRRTELIAVRGKSTRGLRKVFVILTADMVKGFQHVLMVRARAGVNPQNKYLFGRTTTSTPQDGCEAIREVTMKCDGLLNPALIRTRKLSKYLAMTTQVMEMSRDELQLVADHMGHPLAMHEDVYRLQNSVLERTKVARVLGLENGNMGQFRGRDLATVDIEDLPEPTYQENEEEESEEHQEADTEHQVEPDQEQPDQELPDQEQPDQEQSACKGSKRKRWTMEEENDLVNAFKVHITEKRNASTEEIRCAINKYHSLKDRSEAVIRSKVNNIILGKAKCNV